MEGDTYGREGERGREGSGVANGDYPIGSFSLLQSSAPGANGIDFTLYSKQSVDRLAILLDLWSCEAHYLGCKTKVSFMHLCSIHATLPTSYIIF